MEITPAITDSIKKCDYDSNLCGAQLGQHAANIPGGRDPTVDPYTNCHCWPRNLHRLSRRRRGQRISARLLRVDRQRSGFSEINLPKNPRPWLRSVGSRAKLPPLSEMTFSVQTIHNYPSNLVLLRTSGWGGDLSAVNPVCRLRILIDYIIITMIMWIQVRHWMFTRVFISRSILVDRPRCTSHQRIID